MTLVCLALHYRHNEIGFLGFVRCRCTSFSQSRPFFLHCLQDLRWPEIRTCVVKAKFWIQSRFTYTAEHYLKSDIGISDFDRIRENRLVSLNESQNVERHYCHARAHMSDGKKRDIWYVVESPWGCAGMGDGVTYCVSGLDPYRLHGRFCMSLR